MSNFSRDDRLPLRIPKSFCIVFGLESCFALCPPPSHTRWLNLYSLLMTKGTDYRVMFMVTLTGMWCWFGNPVKKTHLEIHPLWVPPSPRDWLVKPWKSVLKKRDIVDLLGIKGHQPQVLSTQTIKYPIFSCGMYDQNLHLQREESFQQPKDVQGAFGRLWEPCLIGL